MNKNILFLTQFKCLQNNNKYLHNIFFKIYRAIPKTWKYHSDYFKVLNVLHESELRMKRKVELELKIQLANLLKEALMNVKFYKETIKIQPSEINPMNVYSILEEFPVGVKSQDCFIRNYPHNLTIELLYDMGLIGTILYYLPFLHLLFFSFSHRKYPNRSDDCVLFTILAVLFILYEQTSGDLYSNTLPYIFTACAANSIGKKNFA